jgi:hypothetical protein
VDELCVLKLQMLENTWHIIEYRLDILQATKDAHVDIQTVQTILIISYTFFICMFEM